MFSRIAINNVKKSFKDYWIYFMTLTFAVCIFYAFNAISDQEVFASISGSEKEYAMMITKVISVISVFVSFVLGGLILYANNFLIKRRKRELGIYTTLGMGKNKISKILVFEELIIGTASLLIGLILGTGLAQILSVFSLKLFNAGLERYKFVISQSAIIKTIIYFAIIFIIVTIFNVIVVSKYKLIDLINAGKANEEIKIKNPFIAVIVFILSIIIIGVAYRLIIINGLDFTKSEFKWSIILGCLGTVLFFYSLTGAFMLISTKVKRFYFKELNLFTIKQINSKINTNFISMAVICLMIFLTISLISIGVGFKNNNVDRYLVSDMNINFFLAPNPDDNKIEKAPSGEEILREYGVKIPNDFKKDYLEVYWIKNNLTEILYNNKYLDEKEYIKEEYNNYKELNMSNEYGIKLSHYNKFLELQGKKKIDLNDDEVIILSTSSKMNKTLKQIGKDHKEIIVNGKKFKVKEYIQGGIENSGSPMEEKYIILGDKNLNKSEVVKGILNVKYENSSNEEKENLIKDINSLYERSSNKDLKFSIMHNTKEDILGSMKMMTTMILYIGFYIGAVFLISSAAVLALQQLSEASDSIGRYQSLRRIGTPESLINKSIFKQTGIYFFLPLGLSIVHTIIAMIVSNQYMIKFGKSDIVVATAISIFIIILIYTGYFLVTYLGYKNIVKKR